MLKFFLVAHLTYENQWGIVAYQNSDFCFFWDTLMANPDVLLFILCSLHLKQFKCISPILYLGGKQDDKSKQYGRAREWRRCRRTSSSSPPCRSPSPSFSPCTTWHTSVSSAKACIFLVHLLLQSFLTWWVFPCLALGVLLTHQISPLSPVFEILWGEGERWSRRAAKLWNCSS